MPFWLQADVRRSFMIQLDDEVCLCFHITKRKLVSFCRRERPRVASQLSECGGAGTGCGWCIPFLKKLHAQEWEGLPAEPGDLSPEEYAKQRLAYHAETGRKPPEEGVGA